MRDGVRLALRISRPAIDGVPVNQPLPVIWQHALTITEEPARDAANPAGGFRDVPSLTAYGYVVVQVARRGNGQSFGIRRGYNDRTEADDAYEITEWLAAQPWSNGKIGIYGCSNTGDAAMQAITSQPPHLKAAFAGCFSWSKFDAFHRGGIYAQWGTGPQRTVEQDLAVEPVDGDEQRQLLSVAVQEHQKSTNLFELWKSMPYRDSWAAQVASRFWYEGSISSFADRLRHSGVAVYIEGGWYDELRDQGLIALLNLPGSRILIGPWKHCANPGFALLQEIHRFFDTVLKDVDTGMRNEPRIHYYTVGAAAPDAPWHATDAWPLADMRRQKLFLQGPELRAAAPTTAQRRDFPVNLDVACPDAGMGPAAQPCHANGVGVSFAGARLAHDIEVTGNPLLHLRVAADRADANFFAYLEDVAPDGSIAMVTEGRLRASMRTLNAAPWHVPDTPWHRSWVEDAAALVPNEPVDLTLDLMPTSYLFKAKHRVQITITGADYRERNRDTDAGGARLSVLSEPQDPSFIELPVIASARSPATH